MKSLARTIRAARSAGEDQGFSIVEVLVGLLLLGILATAILSLLFGTMRVQSSTRARLLCGGFAQQQLESIKSWEWVNFENIAAYGGRYDADPVTVGPYTIYRTVFVSWATQPGDPRITDTTNPALVDTDYFRVEVVCTWNDMGGAAPVRMVTYVKPLDCDPNTGVMLVSVRDHTGAPLPGQNPAVNFQLYSNSERRYLPRTPTYDPQSFQWQYGCLFEGSYEITATFTGAYYDRQGQLLYNGPWMGRDGRPSAFAQASVRVQNRTEVVLELAPPARFEVQVVNDQGQLVTTTVAASLSLAGTFESTAAWGPNPIAFTRLWPGTYDIAAAAFDCLSGGGMLSRTGVLSQYVVQPGNNVVQIPVRPTGSLTMNVEVTRRSDDTAVRARVSATSICGQTIQLGTTDAQGRISRSGMEAGLYRVEATTTAPPILRGSTWVVAASDPTGVGVAVA